MSDPTIVASAMALSILVVFLFRFYRRHVRPGLTRDNWRRTMFGITIIIASVLLSIWWRHHG